MSNPSSLWALNSSRAPPEVVSLFSKKNKPVMGHRKPWLIHPLCELLICTNSFISRKSAEIVFQTCPKALENSCHWCSDIASFWFIHWCHEYHSKSVLSVNCLLQKYWSGWLAWDCIKQHFFHIQVIPHFDVHSCYFVAVYVFALSVLSKTCLQIGSDPRLLIVL